MNSGVSHILGDWGSGDVRSGSVFGMGAWFITWVVSLGVDPAATRVMLSVIKIVF